MILFMPKLSSLLHCGFVYIVFILLEAPQYFNPWNTFISLAFLVILASHLFHTVFSVECVIL